MTNLQIVEIAFFAQTLVSYVPFYLRSTKKFDDEIEKLIKQHNGGIKERLQAAFYSLPITFIHAACFIGLAYWGVRIIGFF